VCVSICLCVSVCVCGLLLAQVESHFLLPCPERLSTTHSSQSSFLNNFLPQHRAHLSLTLSISSDPSSSSLAHTCTHLHTSAHTCTHMRTSSYMCTCAHTCTHMHTHAHTCSHLHTFAHTCTHLHTLAHICTHLHMPGIRDTCAGSGCSAGCCQVNVGTNCNTLQHTGAAK